MILVGATAKTTIELCRSFRTALRQFAPYLLIPFDQWQSSDHVKVHQSLSLKLFKFPSCIRWRDDE